MNPPTSLGTKSNVGKEKPSPSVRQAGSIRGLLGRWGVERGSVSKAGYHVNYRRRCSGNQPITFNKRIKRNHLIHAADDFSSFLRYTLGQFLMQGGWTRCDASG